MAKFAFEPSARLQRLLSRELISDPNLAVVELVKNAYDAGATEALVSLTVEAPGRLVISDNGSGMTESEFRHNWMRPGFSEKARNPGVPIEVGGHSRVPVGEKGLGRLAAGRLGERLEIYTRTANETDWFYLAVDWARFADMDEALNKITFQGKRVSSAPREAFDHGTVLVIEQLTVDFAAKVPGRKVVGRSDNRFGRLAQDLRLLTTTSATDAQQTFEVTLDVDSLDLAVYTGTFGAVESLAEGQFRYDFQISPGEGQRTFISRKVVMGGVDGETTGPREVIIDIAGYAPEVGEVSAARHPELALSGPFSGSFVYAPPARGQRSQLTSGVFLYRDGVRVEPYGDPESDWLGAYSRKASRQGHAPIQPKYLYGAVHIGRKANPDLIDMSNRQGLIENDELVNLLAQVRAEFEFFGQVVLDHQTTPRWNQSQARKRQIAAQQRVEVSKAQSRSFAHAVRQPLTGINAELFTLKQIAGDSRIPDDVRQKLLQLRTRLERAASDISTRVETFLQASDEAITDFSVAEVLSDVSQRSAAICESREAILNVADTVEMVSFARAVLTEALVELVANAVSAEDVEDRERIIRLATQTKGDDVEISVTDNGPGLPPERRDRLFERGVTTSGRPGHGLITQKLNLLGAGGDLVLAESSEHGTTFVVQVPRSAATINLDER